MQRICHIDPNPDPGREKYAALLYLFNDERLGGTGFYRFRDEELVWKGVGMLRDDSVRPDFAPQPSMRSLDVLLGTVRESGLPVDLVVEGTAVELAPGVDLAAYRVVQEALTNALKYAGPARACVTVRWKRGELELEVTNDGTSEPGGDGRGHGLVGLRERVSLVGGSIESGPREDGEGFVVKAHLPLGERS